MLFRLKRAVRSENFRPQSRSTRSLEVGQNKDEDKEIGIGRVATIGLLRGPVYQIFESNGTLVQTQFVLNPDF
jgi:hypothetical protein